MNKDNMYLLDKDNNIIGELDVERVKGNLFKGTIRIMDMKKSLRTLFQEYENLVNDQIFVAAERIKHKIDEYGFKLNDNTRSIEDVQIMQQNKISFREVNTK